MKTKYLFFFFFVSFVTSTFIFFAKRLTFLNGVSILNIKCLVQNRFCIYFLLRVLFNSFFFWRNKRSAFYEKKNEIKVKNHHQTSYVYCTMYNTLTTTGYTATHILTRSEYRYTLKNSRYSSSRILAAGIRYIYKSLLIS